MGLDTVEIVVKVEKTFDINIPDQEIEKVLTVGELHDCVWKHLEGRHTTKCNSQYLFYKLRQSFIDLFHAERHFFELNTSMNEIFPKQKRRELYSRYSETTALQLPNLVLTQPWRVALNSFGTLVILGGLICSLVLINAYDYTKWTLLFPVIGIFITTGVSRLLTPKRTIINPPQLREFTQSVLSLNYNKLTQKTGANRKEVESIINGIIADIGGVELEEVTPEKQIVNDLGIE